MTIRWPSDDYSMTFQWLSNDYLMTIRWLSNDYPMTIQWLSNNYPLTIQWLFNDYPMTIQLLSSNFDLFFLMIIDLKRSIGRKWLFKSGATFIFRWFCFLNTTCPNIHWLFYTSRFLVQRIAKRFARRSKAVSPWPGLMLMPPCIHWPVPCSIRYHWH